MLKQLLECLCLFIGAKRPVTPASAFQHIGTEYLANLGNLHLA